MGGHLTVAVPCVAVTGGIGSGKSTVTDRFASHGVVVVDTDLISHALTSAHHPVLQQVLAQFPEAACPDGSLDRAALRARVFADPSAKGQLEAILHPAIRAEALAQLAGARGPYALLAIPLYFETGAYRHDVARVLVVDCPEDGQVARTMARSGLSEPMVRQIMAGQISREERLAGADDVIDNSGDLPYLLNQVDAMHIKYLGMYS